MHGLLLGFVPIHVVHLAHAVRTVAWAASSVGLIAGRVAIRARRGGSRPPVTRRESRMVFVVGSLRSGTTFVGDALDAEPGPLADALGEVHASSIGRWRQDLTPEQLADVEAEAGVLLAELDYS